MKLKTTIMTMLLVAAGICAVAQEKWEYAVITFHPYTEKLIVSINGTEFKSIDVPKSEVKSVFDVNAGIKEVIKMNSEGWELFNTSSLGTVSAYVFYLRKKK